MARVRIKQRNNTYSYIFELAPQDGKRKVYEKGGFFTSDEAYKAGITAYSEYLNSGLLFTPSEMSVSDYFNYWLEEFVKKITK